LRFRSRGGECWLSSDGRGRMDTTPCFLAPQERGELVNDCPWHCLELIAGCSAPAEVWQSHLGQKFELFRNAFLQPEPPGFSMQNPAGLPLRLNWVRLGNAISRAFGLQAKGADLPIPGTRQVSSWSDGTVPMILTIQTEPLMFRYVICELGIRLQTPFILLAPTSNHLDVACHELLARVRAGFFALSSHLLLTDQGILRMRMCPGNLFQQFTPEPKTPLDEETARSAFALVRALDHKRSMKYPSPATVFGFYCIDGFNISAIARKCHCSRGTVINRLKLIRRSTGVDPDAMRQLSSTFESARGRGSDSRARHIHRNSLADEAEDAVED